MPEHPEQAGVGLPLVGTAGGAEDEQVGLGVGGCRAVCDRPCHPAVDIPGGDGFPLIDLAGSLYRPPDATGEVEHGTRHLALDWDPDRPEFLLPTLALVLDRGQHGPQLASGDWMLDRDLFDEFAEVPLHRRPQVAAVGYLTPRRGGPTARTLGCHYSSSVSVLNSPRGGYATPKPGTEL